MAEEEEIQSRSQYEVHEGIVFAIELTDSLHFVNSDTGKSHLQTILEALQDSMAHSAITLPNTGYGCYMFNGKITTDGYKPGIERLFPLRDLRVNSMKLIYDILNESEQKDDPEAPYVSLDDRFQARNVEQADNPLYDLLTTLQDEFLIKKDAQKQYNIRKIFLFTDNDTPMDPQNFEQKNVVRQICTDLDDSRITVIPFFLTSEHRPFVNSLYSELMFLPQEAEVEPDSIFDGPSTKPITVNDIEHRVLRRKEIKRIQFQCPLIIKLGASEIIVGVKGYAVMSHEKPTANKWLWENEKGRKNVYTHTRHIDPNTGAEFEKTVKGYPLGLKGDIIVMTEKNLEQAEKYNEEFVSFLQFIGTKDEDSGIKTHYVTGRSTFLVPSEDDYEGSTRTLSALYSSLKKKKKVAILFGKLRKGAQPYFYSLQYSRRKMFPESRLFSPEGFYLHRLAYWDDIRQCPEAYQEAQEPDPQLKTITKLLLRDMMQFDPEYCAKDVKNPTLNHHYQTIREYILQVEKKDDDRDESEKKIYEDDSLKGLDRVRQVITKSQFDGTNQMYPHLTAWNKIFEQSL
jgi:ATP-dependent DNA helicase 2 subunit 1